MAEARWRLHPGTDIERLLARFEQRTATQPDGCILWTGRVSRDGYGLITCKADDGKFYAMRAHRVAYAIATGEWPPQLHHKCRRQACIRLDHLSPIAGTKEHAQHHLADACPRCGGEYATLPSGKRQCTPCRREWELARRRAAGTPPAGNAAKGTCKKGLHAWTPENIIHRSSGRTECKVCHRERERARLQRLR